MYTTVSGDTFDIIAFKKYGDEKFAKDIIKANINHANTLVFKGGVKLNIPKVNTTSKSNLPPWKRSD